jgi:hypothetical protein
VGIHPDTLTSKTQWFFLSSLILLAALRAIYLSSIPFSGDTVNSRMATVVVLVHEGRWNIDQEIDGKPNPFSDGTVDKVMVGDHIYSSKPPVLPFLMSVEYGCLRYFFGLSLLEEGDVPTISQLFTVTFVVLPFTLALIGILVWIRTTSISITHQVLVMGAACCGTEMAGYSGTFNNHVPAASLLILAMFLLNKIRSGKKLYASLVTCGFLAGLAATIDIPTAIVAVAIGIGILGFHRIRGFGFYLLGGSLPVLVHIVFMTYLNGSPLPFNRDSSMMDQSLYWYEDAYWRIPMGIDDLHHAKGTYLFHSTLGRHGIFLLYPVMLFGVIGLVLDSYRCKSLKNEGDSRGVFSLLFLASSVILLAYYAFITNNYGGFSFGFRWMIAGVPLFIWGIIRYFDNQRPRWITVIGLLSLGISVYSVWLCQNAPWSINEEWTSMIFGELEW